MVASGQLLGMMAAAAKPHSEFIAQIFDGQCVWMFHSFNINFLSHSFDIYDALVFDSGHVSSSDMITSNALLLMIAANIHDL